MNASVSLQPDQRPEFWDEYVALYEEAFEPLTNQFAASALSLLGKLEGARLIDVGAGAGGASLEAARRGARVTAIDASRNMVARIAERTRTTGPTGIDAVQMDANALAFADGVFNLGLSVFGLVLLPDAARAAAELRRVLGSGGRAAIVTWTQPRRYQLASRLREAIVSIRGPLPAPTAPPAQLRYCDPAMFAALLEGAGFCVETIVVAEGAQRASSAKWLGERLAFAPGLASMLEGLGDDRRAVVEAFVARLEADQGVAEVSLEAVAHIAICARL